jgi:hypothetical protein
VVRETDLSSENFMKAFERSPERGREGEQGGESGQTSDEEEVIGAQVQSQEGVLAAAITDRDEELQEAVVSQPCPLETSEGQEEEERERDQMSASEEQLSERVSARTLNPFSPTLARVREREGGERTCSPKGQACADRRARSRWG